MSETRELVADTARRIMRDLADPQTLNAAESGAWEAPLWQALEEADLTRAWLPEALGGSGLALEDGFAALHVAGAHALPAPLAETMLAGWLLGQAGLAPPDGAVAVAPSGPGIARRAGDGGLHGVLDAVPFARSSPHLAILAEDEAGGAWAALVATDGARLAEGTSLANEPRDTVILDGTVPLAAAALPPRIGRQAFRIMGAAVRATQMAGALQALLELSVAYAQERVAFGRPIGRFQAVQHNLARLGEEAAAALAIANSAAYALDRAADFDAAIFLEAASTKIRVGEAANEGAMIAHQVHGAIGFTREHVLHRYTHRLWSWRDDFGGEAEWAAELGRMMAAGGAEALWPALTAA